MYRDTIRKIDLQSDRQERTLRKIVHGTKDIIFKLFFERLKLINLKLKLPNTVRYCSRTDLGCYYVRTSALREWLITGTVYQITLLKHLL